MSTAPAPTGPPTTGHHPRRRRLGRSRHQDGIAGHQRRGECLRQTRERVLRAVQALNFQPHHGAGALRRGDKKTLTIGLLLDAVDNPFSAAINRAVEIVASQRDTAVFAASFDDDPERERRLVEAFTRRRVDGLILTTFSQDQGYLHSERELGTPIVFVDRLPNGMLADAVVSDNYESVGGGHPAPDLARASTDRAPGRRADHLDRPRPAPRIRRRHGPSPPEPAERCTSTTCAPSRRPTQRSGSLMASPPAAHRTLHQPEHDHHRRRPGAARAPAAARPSPSSASTTSPWPTCSIRASP